MSGRITYRHPPTNRSGEVIIPPLSAATLAALEKALGRTLNNRERDRSAGTIELARFWRDVARVHATTDDCRATLAALVKEPDGAVLAAYDACDMSTRAHLWTALCVHMNLTGPELLYPSQAALKTAAQVALAGLQNQRGRSRTHLRGLARDAAALWREFEGADGAPAARGDYATPLVQFAAALFEASGNPRSLSAIAKLLRAEMPPGN